MILPPWYSEVHLAIALRRLRRFTQIEKLAGPHFVFNLRESAQSADCVHAVRGPTEPAGMPLRPFSCQWSWHWLEKRANARSIPGSVTVAQETLALFVQVRILAG